MNQSFSQRANGVAKTINHFFKRRKDFIAKTTLTNFFPNLLDRIHFRSSGRQKKEFNIYGYNKRF